MRLFRWLKSRFKATPINAVSMVICDGDSLQLRWTQSSAVSVPWNDVQRVLIRTTDQGPFDEDVFFVVETSDNTYVIPQQAGGADQLLIRLQQLQGFRNDAVVDAMSCTENKDFLCWEKT